LWTSTFPTDKYKNGASDVNTAITTLTQNQEKHTDYDIIKAERDK
jgi:hypothetical protein